jgi:hypothetical protein
VVVGLVNRRRLKVKLIEKDRMSEVERLIASYALGDAQTTYEARGGRHRREVARGSGAINGRFEVAIDSRADRIGLASAVHLHSDPSRDRRREDHNTRRLGIATNWIALGVLEVDSIGRFDSSAAKGSKIGLRIGNKNDRGSDDMRKRVEVTGGIVLVGFRPSGTAVLDRGTRTDRAGTSLDMG